MVVPAGIDREPLPVDVCDKYVVVPCVTVNKMEVMFGENDPRLFATYQFKVLVGVGVGVGNGVC